MTSIESLPRSDENDKYLLIEEETLDAIREGRALPTPEFLSENPEAKTMLLKAFEEANYLRESLHVLEPEQRQQFIDVFTVTLEDDNAQDGKMLLQGLLAVGTAHFFSNLAADQVQSPEMYALAGLVATAVAVHRFYHYLLPSIAPSDSHLIKKHLTQIVAS